ncbi:hypothetical protein B0H14DRAFT_2582102 [Mycena olivaceomarginata]|nr:hypothetical protein B0H14DRAFT_2582102 [Mycena olivaceomarginata]
MTRWLSPFVDLGEAKRSWPKGLSLKWPQIPNPIWTPGLKCLAQRDGWGCPGIIWVGGSNTIFFLARQTVARVVEIEQHVEGSFWGGNEADIVYSIRGNKLISPIKPPTLHLRITRKSREETPALLPGGPRAQVRIADSSATIVRSAALGPPVFMKPRLARIKSGSNLDTLVRKHGQTSPLSQCGGIDYEGPTGIPFRQPVQPTTLAPKSTPGTTSACPTTNSGLWRC